jgi:hypothetical protein
LIGTAVTAGWNQSCEQQYNGSRLAGTYEYTQRAFRLLRCSSFDGSGTGIVNNVRVKAWCRSVHRNFNVPEEVQGYCVRSRHYVIGRPADSGRVLGEGQACKQWCKAQKTDHINGWARGGNVVFGVCVFLPMSVQADVSYL